MHQIVIQLQSFGTVLNRVKSPRRLIHAVNANKSVTQLTVDIISLAATLTARL